MAEPRTGQIVAFYLFDVAERGQFLEVTVVVILILELARSLTSR